MTGCRADGTHLFAHAPVDRPACQRITVSAGHGQADLPGATNVCLQAAVDYVAALGGGVVEIAAGLYVMHDSLHVRPRVTVRGVGPETVLFKSPMVSSALSADLGYGHYDISLAEPDLFRPGMGVHIQDDGSAGFYTTCATLLYRDGDRFGINRFLNHDYARRRNAVVRSVFPVVSGYGAEDCVIEDLRIVGNAENNGPLNGCRGGGIFLLRSHRAMIRNVVVENYNGDGISFQQCEDVIIQDALCRRNKGHGFHPGSGSVRPQMGRLRAEANGRDGLFYCLRVSGGLCADSQFVDNAQHGVSIGGRDTDHVVRGCTLRGNGGAGIYFRQADRTMAGSRNTIEHCTIVGNCRTQGEAEIHLDAALADIALANNTVAPDKDADASWTGILIGETVVNVDLRDNLLPPDRPNAVRDLRRTESSKASSDRTLE